MPRSRSQVLAPLQSPKGSAEAIWNAARKDHRCHLGRGQPLAYIDPIGTGEGGPQIIPPGNIIWGVYTMHMNNDCLTFVENLINVARMITGIRPASYDPFELITMINRGRGGFIFDTSVTAGGGVANGTMAGGDAEVVIGARALRTGRLDAKHIRQGQIQYAITALHEIIHHAGWSRPYDDRELARAASHVTGVSLPKLPSNASREEVSERMNRFWHSQLEKACRPRE